MSGIAEPYFDGREMLMIHDMLRREFGLMPSVIRGVAAGDRERAQVVAGHIQGIAAVLHHHHHGEDENVWPFLVKHVPDEVAPVVRLMEDQHEVIAKLGSEIDATLGAWLGDPTAEAREVLADALDRFLPPLKEHLGIEEECVVPLMEQHVTATEWNRMIQASAAEVDPEALPLAFGMLMYEGDPEIVDLAISNMPPEVAPVIRRVAAQAFAAHSELIHGTSTPPRSTEL
ncbi:hypothetical protein Pth03_30800 [Planotetraspora thailandica]|uniref:Hemerythrin-like domain-containing protein n=1 Tax=Planotetraspora thailandica TaxID=487172 RepID=A0A8J3V468_9ACTN|nr:hemerythrin domain-containing protein [Planotetraspora thailandica]GII54691.1 hypothetical protein Pth03_30800 [Planotetraspora thailandica]